MTQLNMKFTVSIVRGYRVFLVRRGWRTGSSLKYQWQYKSAGSTTWNSSTESGVKTASLTVEGLAKKNGQQCRCVIKDGSGKKVRSNAAKLTVTK